MSEVSGRYPKFGVVMPDRTILQYRPFFWSTLNCDPLNVKLVFWSDEPVFFLYPFMAIFFVSIEIVCKVFAHVLPSGATSRQKGETVPGQDYFKDLDFSSSSELLGYHQCSPKSAALTALGFARKRAHTFCSPGVFASTVRANQNYLSLRGKGVQGLDMSSVPVAMSFMVSLVDLRTFATRFFGGMSTGLHVEQLSANPESSYVQQLESTSVEALLIKSEIQKFSDMPFEILKQFLGAVLP